MEIWLQKRDSKEEAGSRDRKQNWGWERGKADKEKKEGGTTQLEHFNTGMFLLPQGALNIRFLEKYLGKAPGPAGLAGGGDFHQKQNRSQHL